MKPARWAITFDDGPLPADLYEIDDADPELALQPLSEILETLSTYAEGPVPATFFLRGPMYPWTAPPPRSVFEAGVHQIEEADALHQIGLHCNRHDPDLWFHWWLRLWSEIAQDLDDGEAFFRPMLTRPMSRFRPPYGAGGPAGVIWASQHNYAYHRWDVDSEDWRHHRDAISLGLGAYEQDTDVETHFEHIRDLLTFWTPLVISERTPREILLHVSHRTAGYLGRILDVICTVTRQLGFEPRFVPPAGISSLDPAPLLAASTSRKVVELIRHPRGGASAARAPTAAPPVSTPPSTAARRAATDGRMQPSLLRVALERKALQARVASDRAARYAEYVKQLDAPAEPPGKGRVALRASRPGQRLRILAEGDSWFEYPLRGNLPLPDGVIHQLQKLLGYPIANLAHHGDEVRMMLGLNQRCELIERLSDRNVRFDALLFSGGGNDLVGDQFCLWVKDAAAGSAPSDLLQTGRVRAAMDCVEAGYRDLIAIRDQHSDQTVIFLHGYDFPPVTGIGVCGQGPWLKPSLDFRHVAVGNDQYLVVRTLLEQFQLMLERVAASSKDVIVVQTQETLISDGPDWQNEIHPSSGGFKKIAEKFKTALAIRFPGP